MLCKIVKWLSNHACLGSLQKSSKFKLKSSISSKAETGLADPNGVMVSELSDPVAIKSVPPRRRTKSSMRILNKVICLSDEILGDNGVMKNQVQIDQIDGDEAVNSCRVFIPDATKKVILWYCNYLLLSFL